METERHDDTPTPEHGTSQADLDAFYEEKNRRFIDALTVLADEEANDLFVDLDVVLASGAVITLRGLDEWQARGLLSDTGDDDDFSDAGVELAEGSISWRPDNIAFVLVKRVATAEEA